jgi:hypothetical protein
VSVLWARHVCGDVVVVSSQFFSGPIDIASSPATPLHAWSQLCGCVRRYGNRSPVIGPKGHVVHIGISKTFWKASQKRLEIQALRCNGNTVTVWHSGRTYTYVRTYNVMSQRTCVPMVPWYWYGTRVRTRVPWYHGTRVRTRVLYFKFFWDNVIIFVHVYMCIAIRFLVCQYSYQYCNSRYTCTVRTYVRTYVRCSGDSRGRPRHRGSGVRAVARV